MIAAHRERFNREYRADRYAAFLGELTRRCGVPIAFRVSETPCFVPASLAARLGEVARELIHQLLDNADYRRAADAEVPPAFRLPRGEARPTFVQVDFGLIDGPAGIEGRLVELQAFPSLYGFQRLLGELSRSFYGFDALSPYLGGIDAATYTDLVGRAITNGHDPKRVVLLEVDPRTQKTRPDFEVTEQVWGVRAIDVDAVRRDGRQLFYDRDGMPTPIARIYNRAIPDDLERAGRTWPFEDDADVDVEWCGGPDWYFRLSKFSLPFLKHPWVPQAHFLSDLRTLPPDRGEWVLKPLYSFAGSGIVFGPGDDQIAAIPEDRRRHYILQRRMAFTPVVATPHGATQMELRIMLLRDADTYRPVLPLARMGRGRMMGVDHNRGLDWVGAAAALIDPER
jgi:hypothetical protein